MIKSVTAVKAKIKNKAGGSSDKAQIMLRIYLMERFLKRVSLPAYRDNYRKTNYYIGGLAWDDVIGSVRILRKLVE